MLPTLYSFRRCPYAMRARLAIAVSEQTVELREVVLKHKPDQLLQASPKATVPVLVLEQTVIDESLGIMGWALQQKDPNNWLSVVDGDLDLHPLIIANDQQFKPILDKYKYFDRHPEQPQEAYLQQALPFLEDLERRLKQHDGFLGKEKFSVLDAAILPFVRQFAHCDMARFESLGLPALLSWLQLGLSSALFQSIMNKHDQWSAEADNGVLFPA